MDKTIKTEYIAIKPKGFAYYIWFKTTNVEIENYCFIGKSGWGKNGALTYINCKTDEIDSFLYSDELQYT